MILEFFFAKMFIVNKFTLFSYNSTNVKFEVDKLSKYQNECALLYHPDIWLFADDLSMLGLIYCCFMTQTLVPWLTLMEFYMEVCEGFAVFWRKNIGNMCIYKRQLKIRVK